MDNNFKKCCPNCSQFYHLNYGGSKTEGNIPLFLSCGHSMCEKCIINITKFMEPIECKVCNHSVEVNTNDAVTFGQNKSKLYQLFPINYLMVGEMISEMVNKPAQVPEKCQKMKQDFEENFIDLASLLKSTDYAQGKCLECHSTTSKMCQQCATVLCDTCFNKTHKNFVIFKNHIHQNIETAQMTNNNCKIHSEKPLDYYCKDCQKSICMDCMMVGERSCKNHNVVAMQEVNENFLTELSDISPQVDEIFRRLTKTAVDIGYLLYNFDNENGSASHLNKIVFSIEQHFSKLLSVVQKHKREVIGTVLKIKNSEKESLVSAKTDVANAIKKAKQTMNLIEQCSDPKKLKQLNLASILEDAQQVVQTPWYLNRDEPDKEPLKLTVNEDLCALMNDYIHLEGNVKSEYKLHATKDLQETEVPAAPPAPVHPPELAKDVRQTQKPRVEKEPHRAPALYKNAPKYRSKCGSVSSLNSNSSDSYITQNECYQKPVVHPVPPFSESQHPAQLYEGSQELVYICHIVNPHNFYVQRACHQALVKEMLREFRNAVSLPTPSINHISQGKIYLVFNKTDNMWQRCRVISIDKTKIKPLFQVFCFDFGSTETVSVDRLRLLPPARVQSPYPLALNCSLANCEPKNGTWTNDDSFLIQNIIDNKQALIHVRRIISTSNTDLKLDCDVITFENGVNLALALAFHERARLTDPRLPYPRTAVMNEKAKIFMDNNFKPESVEEVYITNIVSPDKFFVRKRHLQNVYEKLCEEMEQEYSLSTSNGAVYLPEIGMVCVVNTEKYRSSPEHAAWARCVVKELPGRGRVRVFLPDSGAVHLAHWTTLRYISHKFTTLRSLATECHLAGVTPLHKKWSVASVALLQKYENRALELHVEECRARGSIGVTLYDKHDEENVVCLNKEMIKYKHAVSFGIYMFNKEPIEKQEITSQKPCDAPKQVPKKRTQDKKIKILKKQPSPKVSDEDELEAKDKGPLRLEATVLQCQSPSLIYVSLVHQQKTFNELFEMIQKYYSKNKTPGKAVWSVGDRCCTLCAQSLTWRRAVVLELEGDTAKVFYSDFACTETVPTSSLKELTPDFAGVGDAAIKCHLCGVIPAVGEEWPSLTKEYLKELIDVYQRVFITKLGNFKDKSMPVEVWVYHTIQGGALEPNRSEWRCLNTKIIEQGLGVPDKSQLVQPVASNTEGEGDDMLSFLNVTGSVNQWLQLDPIPTATVNKTPTTTHVTAASSSPFECNDNTSNPNEGGAESPNVVYISDWLPPDPLPCKEFTGVPTYIDNDGVIYLHDISQQDTLDLIRKALDVRFKDPDPKAKYAKWTVGEPCVALFFLDNRFYRGRVMEVNNEQGTCVIHYIDYGNEEVCAFTNLRKSIALHQVPTQAHKCALNRIRPVGKHWDRQTLDYIHKSVVEKQCYVKVAGEDVNGVTPIELKYEKLWINDHLVDFEMAEYTDGSKAVIKKFAPMAKFQQETEVTMTELDPGPEYIVEDDLDTDEPSVTSQDSLSDICSLKGVDWNKLVENEEGEGILTYPKITEEEFVCTIGLINVLDLLELSIVPDEDTGAVYEQMFEEIQKEAPDMPLLKNIYEHKPCVAIFPADGLWYRASVLEYSEVKNKMKVRYVDYGNIDVITLTDAREINEEWVKLAPLTVSAKLHGLELNPEVNIKIVTQEYADTFLDKGPFHAKIINYENAVPTVELRNDSGELIYENLIEKNVLRAAQ